MEKKKKLRVLSVSLVLGISSERSGGERGKSGKRWRVSDWDWE
jgi:hypothetical protein